MTPQEFFKKDLFAEQTGVESHHTDRYGQRQGTAEVQHHNGMGHRLAGA